MLKRHDKEASEAWKNARYASAPQSAKMTCSLLAVDLSREPDVPVRGANNCVLD